MPTKIVTADILNEVGDVLIENVTATVTWGGGGFRINGRWSVSFELDQPIEFSCLSHWIDSDEFWGEIVWRRTEAGRCFWVGIRELTLMDAAVIHDNDARGRRIVADMLSGRDGANHAGVHGGRGKSRAGVKHQ